MEELFNTIKSTCQETFAGRGSGPPNTPAVIPASAIIKESWISKRSRTFQEWRSRYFICTSTTIYTFRHGPCSSYDTKTATEIIDLLDIKSVNTPAGAGSTSFEIELLSGLSFHFISANAQLSESWRTEIQRLVRERVARVYSDDEESKLLEETDR